MSCGKQDQTSYIKRKKVMAKNEEEKAITT